MHDADYWEFIEGGNPYVSSSSYPEDSLLTCALGFVAFDQYKALLQDAEGKISGPRTVIAGFGAGVTESLLAVTPFESIKTTLYVLVFASSRDGADRRFLGLTTARAQTLECAVSSTPFPSSPASAA
jgi:hypothetical protein